MSEAKAKSVKRTPEPEISFDDLSSNFRVDVTEQYDGKFPEWVHSWAKTGTDERILKLKKQEAVLLGGERVEDPMGDFLVRQPRERFEALRERDRQSSLEAVSATINEDSEVSDLNQVSYTKTPQKIRN